VYVLGSISPHTFVKLVCRKTINWLPMSAPDYSTNSSISSKILALMDEITSTIKDMDTSDKKEDLATLNRWLYRSMDSLTVLKCQLLQLRVSQLSNRIASNQTPVSVVPSTTEPATSEKTSSSTSTRGKKKLKRKSPPSPIRVPLTCSLTDEEILVNLHFVNTCIGITKSPFWVGDAPAIYSILSASYRTAKHIYLTSRDPNLTIGHAMTLLLLWKESRMGCL